MSADGSTVVGRSHGASGFEAFRWTSDDGMVGLGDLPGGNFESIALGVSADGSRIVGEGLNPDLPGYQASLWTEETGMVGLGVLLDDPSGPSSSTARAISADGSVVVGVATSTGGDGEAFLWTAADGMVGLGDLPGGDFGSGAYGISADGSTVVGQALGASGREAFVWTSDDGMIGLGDLAGGNFQSIANDASADGSTVVGQGRVESGTAAFIWDETHGMRELQEVLIGLGLDLEGWTLRNAEAISDDGRTIVGSGFNPDGLTEAWIAVVPEPGTALLLGAGLLGLAIRVVARGRARF